MPAPAVRLSSTMRWLFRGPASLYRVRCGWLLGHRFMLLAHVGRRTGLRRHTVLEVVEYRAEGPEVVVVSGFGPNANWLRNLATTPEPKVVTGRQHFVAAYRILGVPEAVAVIAGYEARNRAMAPVVRWVLSRLLGWSYRGTDPDRRRMAEQLPFIAFRPRFDSSSSNLTDGTQLGPPLPRIRIGPLRRSSGTATQRRNLAPLKPMALN